MPILRPFFYHITMNKKRAFFITLSAVLLATAAQARFPFSFSKPTIKTDYSQTVWDQIMQDQAVSDMRRGMSEMSRAQYQEASNSFAKAVVKNAKDPMGYLLLGASLYWAGKVDDAISEYKEALHLDPNNPMAYQLLGIAAGWKGDIATAQAYFLTANKLDPNKADTHMNLGSTYAVQNKLEDALEHFRRSTELAPREPLYHYQLGTLYEALGRDAQAEESFKKALHLFSAYEDAQLSLAALYEGRGRLQEALKFYKKAVKTKPGDYVARLRYAFLLVRMGQEKTAREILEEAFSIAKFNQDGLALNAAYRASGTTPQDFEKQIEKFADNVSQVSAAKPVQIEVSLEYLPPAQNNQSQGRSRNSFEREYQKLRQADLLTPAEQDTGVARTFKRAFTLPAADSKERAKQIEDFTASIRQAVSQVPQDYVVNLSLQGRTVDYRASGAISQNRSAPPKAVYDPRVVGNDMGLWVMGRTWLKFVEEAEEDLQEFSCPPGNICALLKGLAALAKGNATAAQENFTQAATQSPQDVLAELGLGTSFVVADNDEEARHHYKRALEISPKNKTAKRNLKILTDN